MRGKQNTPLDQKWIATFIGFIKLRKKLERYAALDFCSLFVTYCGKKSPEISKNEIKRIALKRRNTGNYSK